MALFKTKPRRLGAFLCLIMGLIILISCFLPLYTAGPAAITPYDSFKALINKDHLIPEKIEQAIYDTVGKILPDSKLSTSGTGHNAVYKIMTQSESKLYAYLTYIGSVVMMFSGALLVLFGLLGTIIRAKLFKSANIIFSITALLGGILSIVGPLLLAKKLAALSIAMSYFMIIPVVASLLAFILVAALKSKRKIH